MSAEKIQESSHNKQEAKPSKIINYLKSVPWETWLFVAVLAILLLANFNLISQLKQLPSPLYGGDYYNHLGSINHIYQGGSIFQSGQMLGEIQWVPFLYHALVVLFAKITGLAPLFANIYFSLVALALGCTIMYLFISSFFNNRIYGVLAAILHAMHFPLYKYSPFAFHVILPLFFFAAYHFMKKKDWKSALLFGITYGLCGLSNTYVFIISTFILGFLLLYLVLFKNVKIRLPEKKLSEKIIIDRKNLVTSFYLACIIFFIGFAIALLWWFKPIFVYHAHTANDMQIYGFPEVNGIGDMMGLVTQGIKQEFTGFSFAGMGYTIKKLGLILGILALLLMKKRKDEHNFIIIALLASLFGLMIHFITIPLLGTLMASQGLFNTGLVVTSILLTFLALDVMIQYAKKIHKYGEYALLALFAILVLISIHQHLGSVTKDYWWGAGVSETSPHLVATRNWVLDNTELNDVFLTTNEDGFALNALTGRKVVTYRRTHASPYADMNQRMLDTGIMLHAQNNIERVDLLKKYSVDYIYWQPGWLNNELRFNANGQLEGFFDPLSMDYTPEREADLIRNNVSYIKTKWYMDPAWLPTYPQRDLLIIMPGRPSYETPWSPTLDTYLTLEKEIIVNGQVAGRIYKVNVNLIKE